MSKSKLAMLTGLVAASILMTTAVKADDTWDKWGEEKVINIALSGDRGSEGSNTEKINQILKSIPYFFTFNRFR